MNDRLLHVPRTQPALSGTLLRAGGGEGRGQTTRRWRVIVVIGALTAAVTGLSGLVGVAAELTDSQIYAKASPAVVFVFGSTEDRGVVGTGTIIRGDGLVLTNAHVVTDMQTGQPHQQIWVALKPEPLTGRRDDDLGNRVKVQVVAIEQNLDVALLRAQQAPQPLPVLELGNPAAIQIGDHVLAIGHPEEGGLWSLTTGVISASNPDFMNIPGKDVFQSETGMNRGNSGGPLLDAHGFQIGVNTAIARLAKDGMPITSISYSLKSSVVQAWLAKQGVRIEYAAAPPLPKPRPEADKPGPMATLPPTTEKKEERPAARPGYPAPAVAKPAAPAQPQAPSLTPPPRPYNIDTLVRDLVQVERDLNKEMEDSMERIRKLR